MFGSRAIVEQKRIFMLGRARSGTTVFRHMLESHPDIAAYPEIFNLDSTHNYFKFLAKKCKKDSRQCYPQQSLSNFHGFIDSLCARHKHTPAVVFDVKYECMHVVHKPWQAARDVPAVLEEIKKSGWLLLHVTRRNHLRRIISNMRAMESGVYHADAGGQNIRQNKIRLNPKDLLDKFRAFDAAYNQTAEYFDGYGGFMEVDYDSMFGVCGETRAFSQKVIEQVAAFCGLPDKFDRMPKEGRATPFNPAEALANFEDVAAVLKGTQYEEFLK